MGQCESLPITNTEDPLIGSSVDIKEVDGDGDGDGDSNGTDDEQPQQEQQQQQPFTPTKSRTGLGKSSSRKHKKSNKKKKTTFRFVVERNNNTATSAVSPDDPLSPSGATYPETPIPFTPGTPVVPTTATATLASTPDVSLPPKTLSSMLTLKSEVAAMKEANSPARMSHNLTSSPARIIGNSPARRSNSSSSPLKTKSPSATSISNSTTTSNASDAFDELRELPSLLFMNHHHHHHCLETVMIKEEVDPDAPSDEEESYLRYVEETNQKHGICAWEMEPGPIIPRNAKQLLAQYAAATAAGSESGITTKMGSANTKSRNLSPPRPQSSIKIRHKRTTRPGSIQYHPIITTPLIAPSESDAAAAKTRMMTSPPPQSVDRSILAQFHKLKIQAQLQQQELKLSHRKKKFEDRYADVLTYRRLYKEFEDMKSAESTLLAQQKGQGRRKLKRSKSFDSNATFDLKDVDSWFYDFHNLGEDDDNDDDTTNNIDNSDDDDNDNKENKNGDVILMSQMVGATTTAANGNTGDDDASHFSNQSQYSLLSAASIESQRRFYAAKRAKTTSKKIDALEAILKSIREKKERENGNGGSGTRDGDRGTIGIATTTSKHRTSKTRTTWKANGDYGPSSKQRALRRLSNASDTIAIPTIVNPPPSDYGPQRRRLSLSSTCSVQSDTSKYSSSNNNLPTFVSPPLVHDKNSCDHFNQKRFNLASSAAARDITPNKMDNERKFLMEDMDGTPITTNTKQIRMTPPSPLLNHHRNDDEDDTDDKDDFDPNDDSTLPNTPPPTNKALLMDDGRFEMMPSLLGNNMSPIIPESSSPETSTKNDTDSSNNNISNSSSGGSSRPSPSYLVVHASPPPRPHDDDVINGSEKERPFNDDENSINPTTISSSSKEEQEEEEEKKDDRQPRWRTFALSSPSRLHALSSSTPTTTDAAVVSSSNIAAMSTEDFLALAGEDHTLVRISRIPEEDVKNNDNEDNDDDVQIVRRLSFHEDD